MSSSDETASSQNSGVTDVVENTSGVASNQRADNNANESTTAEALKNDRGTPEELSDRFVESYKMIEGDLISLAREFETFIKTKENRPKYQEGPFEGEDIKFQISSRAKDVQSLKEKLKQECESRVELVKKRALLEIQIRTTKEKVEHASKDADSEEHANDVKNLFDLRDQRKKMSKKKPFESIYDIHMSNAIWDLVGVRILSYFPDDISIILRHIMELFDTVGTPQVRDAPRTHRQIPKVDRAASYSQEEIAERLSDYVKGSWMSKSADEIERDWKHAGYRAVHVHVRQKGSESRPEDRWKVRAEIQLTTPVMHAWSEIEHDIIYKNRYDLPQDQTTDRMIDAFNGLAITSEILLQELQKTLITAKETNEKRFKDNEELEDWVRHWCPERLPELLFDRIDTTKKTIVHNPTELISCFSQSVLLDKTWDTRKGIRALFNATEFKTYRERGSSAWDALLAVLLKNICKSYSPKNDVLALGLDINSPSKRKIVLLYKLFFVSKIFTNYWFLMWGDVKKFWNSDAKLDKIDTINSIFVGEHPFPMDEENQLSLTQYADQVLGWEPDAALEIAMSFTKLGLTPRLVPWEVPAGSKSTLLDGTGATLRGVPLDFTLLIYAWVNLMHNNGTPDDKKEYEQEYKLGGDHLRQMYHGLRGGGVCLVKPQYVKPWTPPPVISVKVPRFEDATFVPVDTWSKWAPKYFLARTKVVTTEDEWMAREKRLKLFEWQICRSEGASKLHWHGPRATLKFLKLVLGELDDSGDLEGV